MAAEPRRPYRLIPLIPNAPNSRSSWRPIWDEVEKLFKALFEQISSVQTQINSVSVISTPTSGGTGIPASVELGTQYKSGLPFGTIQVGSLIHVSTGGKVFLACSTDADRPCNGWCAQIVNSGNLVTVGREGHGAVLKMLPVSGNGVSWGTLWLSATPGFATDSPPNSGDQPWRQEVGSQCGPRNSSNQLVAAEFIRGVAQP
jgi:hypothetical protein